LIFARRGFVGLSLLGVAAPLVSENAWAQVPIWPPPTSPGVPPLSASQVLANLEALYNRHTTFKASFTQRYSIYSHNLAKHSQGSVFCERPDRMSWTYSSNGNRVVSDGQLIRIYEKATGQMFEQPLSRSQYPAALSFLIGPTSNLSRSMSFSLLNAANMKYASGYVLLGVPHLPSSAYARVFYYVDAKTFSVRRVLIQDQHGNRNRFDFDNLRLSPAIPPGTFVLTPPPGTQVITVNGATTAPAAQAPPIQP
jgi:outer membrane lipoprotein carrier protein